MKEIAILIPVYNYINFTKKCIENLNKLITNTKLENCKLRIVVIDDGSTDGTSEWIQKYHPEVLVLQGDGNLWWSGGINKGAKYAINELNVDFLLLWNNDIIPANDYFHQLDKLVPKIDQQIIAGSKIYYYETGNSNIIWSFGGVFNPRNGKKYMVGYNSPDNEEFADPIHVDWLPGMGTLVSKEIVNNIGLWDEKVFPQYHGDSDFTFRAKTRGYKIISFPQLVLWNDKSASGISHDGTLKSLYQTLVNRRSNSNIKDNFRFYKRHSKSVLAYGALFGFYALLVGGFFKWKLLSLFGIKKSH